MIRRVPQPTKKMKLDIGCGEKKKHGYIGMDVRDCGQEVLWDARQGIPFPDESADEVNTSHFIEHLDDDASIDFIQEAMRVLKHKGKFIVRCPHQLSPTAYYTGHKSFWNEWRVEALLRQTEKIHPFVITENKQEGHELTFTLTKV